MRRKPRPLMPGSCRSSAWKPMPVQPVWQEPRQQLRTIRWPFTPMPALSLIGERHAGRHSVLRTLEYGFRQRQCALRRGGILYSRLAELPVGRSALFPRTFGRVDRRTGISRRNSPSARPFGGGRLRPSDRPESSVFADGPLRPFRSGIRGETDAGRLVRHRCGLPRNAPCREGRRWDRADCGWPTSAPM